jgi:hypothetical protein
MAGPGKGVGSCTSPARYVASRWRAGIRLKRLRIVAGHAEQPEVGDDSLRVGPHPEVAIRALRAPDDDLGNRTRCSFDGALADDLRACLRDVHLVRHDPDARAEHGGHPRGERGSVAVAVIVMEPRRQD